MTKNWKKFTAEKSLNFLDKNILQFIYLVLKGYFRKAFPDKFRLPVPASIKDVQATEEAFSFKREHSALQIMKFAYFFLFLWIIFILLDPYPDSESGSGSTELTENQNQIRIWKRIRSRNTVLNSTTRRLRTGQAFFKESRGSVSAINDGSGSGMVKS